jgi:uncharacterized membrane protein
MQVDEPIAAESQDHRRHLGQVGHTALHLLRRGSQQARNVNELEAERQTPGQRVADVVANTVGSWHFIIAQSVVLLIWLVLNVVAWVREWDPYPFILLNLALSFQAAYSAPIIMMSQNRQAAKDRLHAEEDFRVNLRAELEVEAIQSRLDDLAGRQWVELLTLQKEQLEILARIETLTAELHRLSARLAVTDGRSDSLSVPR